MGQAKYSLKFLEVKFWEIIIICSREHKFNLLIYKFKKNAEKALKTWLIKTNMQTLAAHPVPHNTQRRF